MASYNRASERALATLALEWAAGATLWVLVGGLGMGFTLRAALDHPAVGAVEVVEVEPAIVEWNRTHLADLAGGCLDDPRVRLVQADVVRYLATAPGPYDAICLDVDNGPGWLASPGNRRLYSLKGLGEAAGAAGAGWRAGGVVGGAGAALSGPAAARLWRGRGGGGQGDGPLGARGRRGDLPGAGVREGAVRRRAGILPARLLRRSTRHPLRATVCRGEACRAPLRAVSRPRGRGNP